MTREEFDEMTKPIVAIEVQAAREHLASATAIRQKADEDSKQLLPKTPLKPSELVALKYAISGALAYAELERCEIPAARLPAGIPR